MRRLLILLFVSSFTLWVVARVEAKRSAPSNAKPVSSNNVEYRAPHTSLIAGSKQMGFVEAWDKGANRLIWRRQVYVVKYQTDLETDVQDVFITNLEIDGETLTITNERKSRYALNLNTLEVTVIKGRLVETTM